MVLDKMNHFAEVLERNGIRAQISTVTKNGVTLNAITIGDAAVRPTIYEDMVEKLSNASEEEIVDEIKRILSKTPDVPKDAIKSWFSNEFISENAFVTVSRYVDDDVVSFDTKYEDLKEYIKLKVIDEGTITLKKEHLNYIDMSLDELKARAEENTFSHALCVSMAEALKDSVPSDMLPDVPLYVLTNELKTHGAGQILNEKLLDSLAKKLNTSMLQIIPSSTHELIVLSADEESPLADLLVQQVNAECVSETEQLSDHCYYHYCA